MGLIAANFGDCGAVNGDHKAAHGIAHPAKRLDLHAEILPWDLAASVVRRYACSRVGSGSRHINQTGGLPGTLTSLRTRNPNRS